APGSAGGGRCSCPGCSPLRPGRWWRLSWPAASSSWPTAARCARHGGPERDRVMPMRIVQLTSTSAGGVARHARQVAGLLAGAGHRVVLAGPADVVAIADRPRPTDVAALRRLRAVLHGADLVHAHGLRAGAAAVLAATGLPYRPAVVVTLHNLPVGGPRVRAMAAVLERVVA